MNKTGNVYNKIVKNINSFRNTYVLTDKDTKDVADILESINYPEFEEDSDTAIEAILNSIKWDIDYPARKNTRLTNGIVVKSLGKPNKKDKEKAVKELKEMSGKIGAALLGYGETVELSLCCYDGNPSLRIATEEEADAPVLQAFLDGVYSRSKVESFEDKKIFQNTIYATAKVPFIDEKGNGKKKDKEDEKPYTNWIDMINAGILTMGDYRINVQFVPLDCNNTLLTSQKEKLLETADELEKFKEIQWSLNTNVAVGFNKNRKLQAVRNAIKEQSNLFNGNESGSRNYATSINENRKEKSKAAELCLKRIDKELQKIDMELQTTPWQIMLSVEANDENVIQSACSILNSCFSKEGYELEWGERKVTASIMPPEEAEKFLRFPIKEFPGFTFEDNEEFLLTSPADSDNGFNIGKLLFNGKEASEFYLPEKALNRHAFICGMTGAGKTNTLFNILENANVPFLVIEPVKGEYRCLRSEYDDTEIWTMKSDGLTEEGINLLQINPFWFPEGTNISFHIDSIKTIISSAFELNSAMPNILEQCMYSMYIKAGWNIVTNKNIYEDKLPSEFLFPTFSDLLDEIEYYLDHSKFEGETLGNYRGALSSRLKSFVGSYKGLLLNTQKHPDYEKLMNNHSIIELEGLADDADKCLVMGTVLIQYYEYLKLHFKGDTKGLQHIIVIEEAHRLFKNVSQNKSNTSESVDPAAQLVDYLNNLMAEIRAFGEGMLIVDQSPTKISEDVIKNSATKIIHRIDNSKDIKLLTSALLIPDDKTSISSLMLGETLIRTEGMKKPCKVKIKRSDVKEDYDFSDSFKSIIVQNKELEYDYAAMAILSNDELLEIIHIYLFSLFKIFNEDGFGDWKELLFSLIDIIREKLIEYRCYDLTNRKDEVIYHILLTAVRSVRSTINIKLGILEIGMISLFLKKNLDVFDYYKNELILKDRDVSLLENFFIRNIHYIAEDYIDSLNTDFDEKYETD